MMYLMDLGDSVDNAFVWESNANFLFWIISLVIGLVLFVLGIVWIIIDYKKKIYVRSLIAEFIACWILHAPYEFSNTYTGKGFAIQLFESYVVALIKTFTKYMGEGYSILEYYNQPIFTAVYNIVTAFVNISMLLMFGGILISFLDGPVQRERLYRKRDNNFYIFSACNEKCFAIAKSLMNKDKKNILFVVPKEETIDEYKEKVDKIGGYILNDDLSNVLRKYLVFSDRKIEQIQNVEEVSKQDIVSKEEIEKRLDEEYKIKIFLFNDSEKDNLSQMKSITKELKEIKENTRLYVELLDTPWDLYNNDQGDSKEENGSDANNKIENNVKVVKNYIRVEENFVYNNLLENSIFENYDIDDSGQKRIKILIAGYNDRNIELLKAVLHLSQMPGYIPTIVFIDDLYRYDNLYSIMPEILQNPDERRPLREKRFDGDNIPYVITKKYNIDGDAIYNFEYYYNIDFNSFDFDNIITKYCCDFGFAFVNVADDLSNLNLALHLRTIRERSDIKSNYLIQVNILDKNLMEEQNGNQNKDNFSRLLDKIKMVGSIDYVYSYSLISNSNIEYGTRLIHKYKNPNKPWEKYSNNEYKRHSVYARTLSYKYKNKIIKEMGEDLSIIIKPEEPWQKYEHMRWNVYTRTLGYSSPSGNNKEVLRTLEKEITNLNNSLNETDEHNKEYIKKALSDKNKERKKIRDATKYHEDLIPYAELNNDVQCNDNLFGKQIKDTETGELIEKVKNIKSVLEEI